MFSHASHIARGTAREISAYVAALGWSNAAVLIVAIVAMVYLCVSTGLDPVVVLLVIATIAGSVVGGAMKSVTNAINALNGDVQGIAGAAKTAPPTTPGAP